MAKGTTYAQVSAMPSNPYPVAKQIGPLYTLCELCNRSMPTRDWAAHKNSKGHRKLEEKEKEILNGGVQSSNGNHFDSAGDFKPETNAKDAFTSKFDNLTIDTNGNSNDWNSSAYFGTDTYSSNTNGGGDRTCYGCGLPGHSKRDCPRGGGKGSDGACYGCGQTGHQKRDCPNNTSGGQACFNCGEEGHRKMECPHPRKPMGGGGSDRACYNCGTPGHNKFNCPESLKASDGGGGRTCHNCKGEGHISRDCPEPRVMRCRNCDEENHQARECPKPKDWSRVKCTNCEKYGHGARRCPEPPREGDAGGDWGHGGGYLGAAVGDWTNGGGDVHVGAGTPTSGNWADETTAAANVGESWGGGDAGATNSW